jgi:hypothetical protein
VLFLSACSSVMCSLAACLRQHSQGCSQYVAGGVGWAAAIICRGCEGSTVCSGPRYVLSHMHVVGLVPEHLAFWVTWHACIAAAVKYVFTKRLQWLQQAINRQACSAMRCLQQVGALIVADVCSSAQHVHAFRPSKSKVTSCSEQLFSCKPCTRAYDPALLRACCCC